MKSKIVCLLLAAAFTLAVCAGCAPAEKNGAEPTPAPETAPDTGAAADTAERMPFDYSGVDENGELQSIPELCAEYEITLVNFWATWCGPCVSEMPGLQSLYAEQKENGIGVIGIWIDTENPEDKAAALKNAGVEYPVLAFDEAMQEAVALQYIPVSIFLDGEGRMIGQPVVGAHSGSEWLAEAESRRESLKLG